MKIATTFFLLVAIAFIPSFSSATSQSDETKNAKLSDAVDQFNQRVQSHEIGKNQPKLTEQEVIAAIRGWIPERHPNATDEVVAVYQKIAETGELPPGAELSFCPSWNGYRGYVFTVWWVDLSIRTGEKTGYGFRIRDQKISSRKMTLGEIAEQERHQKSAAEAFENE